MMVKNFLLTSALFISTSGIFMAENSLADTSKTIAVEAFEGVTVAFREQGTIQNATLSISGPSAFFASKASKNNIPSINLTDFGDISDGRYKYQITSSDIGTANIETTKPLNNGRNSDSRKAASKSISQTGHFYLKDGQIKHFSPTNDTHTR